MTWFLLQLGTVSTLTFPPLPKANDQSSHLLGEIQINILIYMSVDPHKYSVGPGIFQCNSYFSCMAVRIFRGKSLPGLGCRNQHVPPCLYSSISNTHHGKGQQLHKCHCSSASQHWRDTKSTRIYSNHLYPLSVVAESQM